MREKPKSLLLSLGSKADWIHQDLSITDQAETFVNSIMHFLSDDGIGLLSLKAASESTSMAMSIPDS